jgi:predicted nucleic acid-binding protein
VGLILLDSTAIVGFLDADDALHEVTVARFREIVPTHALVASAISYAELMTGVSLGHHPAETVDGFFQAFVREILPADTAVGARAGALRGGHPSLRMPDALILATGDLYPEIEAVLCGDRHWAKVKGLDCRVELLKPAPPKHSRATTAGRSQRP